MQQPRYKGSLLPPSSLLIQPGREPHIPLLAFCQSEGLAPISQASHHPTTRSVQATRHKAGMATPPP